MSAYIIRRLILLIPTMLIVTIVLFLVIRLMPGNVIELMVLQHSQEQAGELQLDEDMIREMMGLNKPIHTQYFDWVSGIFLRGDFGTSLWTERTLTEDLRDRIAVTFELGLLTMIVMNVIGIPIGIYSAIRQDTWLDYVGRSFAILSLATPAFWLATMLIVYGSIYFNWSPQIEYIPFTVNPLANLRQLIIPAVLIGTAGTGGMVRFLRTIMLEVLRQDYVRTAWSKGLTERVIVIKHALRNALIPVITMFAPQVGMLIGGSVIMEQIFCLPGMGRYLLETLTRRDYLLVSGTNLIYGGFAMFMILLTDLSYAWADPRVRYR